MPVRDDMTTEFRCLDSNRIYFYDNRIDLEWLLFRIANEYYPHEITFQVHNTILSFHLNNEMKIEPFFTQNFELFFQSINELVYAIYYFYMQVLERAEENSL